MTFTIKKIGKNIYFKLPPDARLLSNISDKWILDMNLGLKTATEKKTFFSSGSSFF